MQAAAVPAVFLALLLAPAAQPGRHSFTDEGLHFTFTYPADFIASPSEQEVRNRMEKQSSDQFKPILHCVAPTLLAVRSVAEHQQEMITLFNVDFGCMGRAAEANVLVPMARNSLTKVLERIGQPTLLDPVAYHLDSYDAVFIQGSAPDTRDGNPGYGGIACVLIINTVSCWSTLTAYPTHLPSMFANTITFRGHAEQPLVPAGVVVTPVGKDPH